MHAPSGGASLAGRLGQSLWQCASGLQQLATLVTTCHASIAWLSSVHYAALPHK